MLGRPELRVDGTTVPGQTFKMTFICKLDEADSVAFNGEVTNWSRKTKDTPHGGIPVTSAWTSTKAGKPAPQRLIAWAGQKTPCSVLY